jgi:hypothetical protein
VTTLYGSTYRVSHHPRRIVAYTDDRDCVPPDARKVWEFDAPEPYAYARAASITRPDLTIELNTHAAYVLFHRGLEVKS